MSSEDLLDVALDELSSTTFLDVAVQEAGSVDSYGKRRKLSDNPSEAMEQFFQSPSSLGMVPKARLLSSAANTFGIT